VPAPLLIADVPWLLYRSFFALPKSIVGAGRAPVNALLGTVNALLRLADGTDPSQRPRAVAACTGAEEAAYRVELYPPYHAHREPMPPELRAQWSQAPALLEAMGWSVCGSDELEADDVMFSLARLEEQHGGRSLLFTGDRDLYGAVSDASAVVELPKSGEPTTIEPDGVRERYGVNPEQVPDLIALRGDPSDGIPGAPGVGAKTAAALLQAHGSLEGVLAAAAGTGPGAGGSKGGRAGGSDSSSKGGPGEIKPRIAAALLENAELLGTFKRIATLQSIAVERPADAITDYERGARAAGELGMRRLAERLEQLATART
jgi:5'-3' exonuclease